MIRAPKLEDKEKLNKLFSSVNLFNEEELEFMSGLIDSYFEQNIDDSHFWLVSGKDDVNGACYYAPEAFGKEVYNLYFIGVMPDQQGQGVGSALLQAVENHLRKLNQRLLLVETSGLSKFEKTREFYLKNDFHHEATIHDYYNEGEDKLTYVKNLND